MTQQVKLMRLIGGLGLLVGSLSCLAQPAGPPAAGGLSACASLPSDAERLACYDTLAGRAPGAPQAPQAVAAAPTSAAPRASAPAAAPAPTSPATPARAASAPPAAAPAAPANPAAPASTASFGLYAAEHPKPPPVSQALEARVVAVGHSLSGRMTVSLEDGALWELEEADPLLAEGDTVSIKRAALGSYLMRTPSQRLLRARRVH
ncbi:MAG TPA: hypothetical protein VNX02_04745 [Steroidobacteraceae bacterium]|jgi:hypothetical protein|nr:hypothetical protein [Steroidobacteraceae bacterium]